MQAIFKRESFMKMILIAVVALGFNTLAYAKSVGALLKNQKERCKEGYKKVNKTHRLKADMRYLDKICENAVKKEGQSFNFGDMKFSWGNRFHLMLVSAAKKSEKELMLASCKVGALIAVDSYSSSFAQSNLSPSVVAYEACVGPLKDGAIIEKNKVYSDGTVSKKWSLKYNKGKFVKHGKLNEFFKDGKIKQEASFKDGKKDGPLIWYTESGKKTMLKNYKMGDLHGQYQDWDNNGVLLEEGQYKNDKRDGLWKRYDDGELELEIKYKDGDVVSKTHH